jgi:hypothetical protein
MNGQTSFASLGDCRCTVCGAIQAGKTSAARNRLFACSRCHTGLQVIASPSIAVISASILISLTLSVAMGLRGPSFTLGVAVATAVFNWLGQSVGKLLVAPKLRVRPNAEAPSSPQNILSAHPPIRPLGPARGRTSLRCPVVGMHN